MPWYQKLAKNYLFFRIPFITPDSFLTKMFPKVSWIFSKKFAYVMIILGVIGLIKLTGKFDVFTHTFSGLIQFSSFLYFALALIVAKIFHELGHALTCKKYGLTVPRMGIAFLVMFPMLYTDTHQSWKLKEPRKRMFISMAGVIAEIYVAIIALWLWFFLPPGGLKSAVFFLCTFSLLATLLINVSPFLRFDGYWVLSDLIKMRNLQTRSFAIARWWMREKLFGLRANPPEHFIPVKKTLLILYAFCTWLYRFILFIGIAILIYYFFFKALGIILFVVEIYYFIVQPIVREIVVWYKLRKHIGVNVNTTIVGVVIFCLLLLFFVPFSKKNYLPAMAFNQVTDIFTPVDAEVQTINVRANTWVKEGALLLTLNSPKLENEIQRTKMQIEALQWKIRNIGVFQQQQESLEVLYSELSHLKSKLKAQLEKKGTLRIVAESEGYAHNLIPFMQKGMWFPKNAKLLVLVNPAQLHVEALANYRQVQKIKVDEKATFVPDNINMPRIFLSIASIGEHTLPDFGTPKEGVTNYMYLASTYDGKIATIEHNNRISPNENIHVIQFRMAKNQQPYKTPSALRGEVIVYGHAESYAAMFFKAVAGFLLKESGF